jgi:hypothetical protein
MERGDEMSSRERTVAAMHDTAEQLEVVEGVLHRSAEASPNEQTTHRLHALGDAVTEQARHIDERADQMIPSTARAEPLSPADGANYQHHAGVTESPAAPPPP